MTASTRLLICLVVAMIGTFGTRPAAAEGGTSPVGLFMADELEAAYDGEEVPLAWGITAWFGWDRTRFWLKSEGELTLDTVRGDAEAQLLYSRLITPFWEFQLGIRCDGILNDGSLDGRAHAVIGLDGVLPFWVELEPAVFVSDRGDVSARITATHDLNLTQRLVAESQVEANAAIQSAPEFGVGRGFNDLGLALRLRFEITRKFAPYLGVDWTQKFGEAARLNNDAGEGASAIRAVAGLRFWF